MMVMRLIIKSIASVTSIAKPVVIPGMVPIVVVVVSSPILVVIFASESIVAIIIVVIVAVVPLIAVVVIVDHSTAAASIHHLVVLVALEWILLLLHSVSLLIAIMLEVGLHLLRPTAIHFGVAIVFQLTLPVVPPLVRQLSVHVRLLAIPAADWSSVATM